MITNKNNEEKPAEKGSKPKGKVFIVDNHPLLVIGLSQLISQRKDLTVCGTATACSDAVKTVGQCQPDMAVVDIAHGSISGIRLVEELATTHALSTLVLSGNDESLYAERCLRAGARGYIMKTEPPETIMQAIIKVLNGGLYLSSRLSTKFLTTFLSREPELCHSPVELLSNRELEVFELLGQGVKTRKIAEQLKLSVKTIETYLDHIKKKMKFNDSRELLMHAIQWVMGENSK